MKIVWTRFAVESLKDIYRYYLETTNPALAAKIRNGIISEAKKINKYPLSGQRQEVLSPLQHDYRYFLKNHYKIVYRIINDELLITDIFDTRQNPSGMNNDRR